MKQICFLIISILTGLPLLAADLCNGDLLFQLRGDSDMSQAISASTSYPDSLDFVHVAIVWINPNYQDDIKVIEASPIDGVHVLSLEQFLSDSPKINGRPGVVVKRVKKDIDFMKVIGKALSFVGQPYDFYYLPNNDKMYCSELVYESFTGVDGLPVFHSKPMNFRDKHGNMPKFWEELFSKINISVPEGVEGTNPNDMAREAFLVEITRYF